ncbi:hypothetical protein D3C79_993980 [compost metagenome]
MGKPESRDAEPGPAAAAEGQLERLAETGKAQPGIQGEAVENRNSASCGAQSGL